MAERRGQLLRQAHRRPQAGIHALQLEINRALYLDESSLTRTAGFVQLQTDLTTLCRRLFAEFTVSSDHRAAAE